MNFHHLLHPRKSAYHQIKGIAIGIDDFLAKTVAVAEWTSALDKWLPSTTSK